MSNTNASRIQDPSKKNSIYLAILMGLLASGMVFTGGTILFPVTAIMGIIGFGGVYGLCILAGLGACYLIHTKAKTPFTQVMAIPASIAVMVGTVFVANIVSSIASTAMLIGACGVVAMFVGGAISGLIHKWRQKPQQMTSAPNQPDDNYDELEGPRRALTTGNLISRLRPSASSVQSAAKSTAKSTASKVPTTENDPDYMIIAGNLPPEDDTYSQQPALR